MRVQYDVFISYAREDHVVADRLARRLTDTGFRVFIDKASVIPGGRFDEAIDVALREAQAVVVLWSEVSVGKDWIKDEANAALSRSNVVPCFLDHIDPSKLPLRFRALQTVDLRDWVGERDHDGYVQLLAALYKLCPEREPSRSRHFPARNVARVSLDDEIRNFPLSTDMARAIELAVATERPLFITGEYGVPKTRFPQRIAYDLNAELLFFDAQEDSRFDDLLFGHSEEGDPFGHSLGKGVLWHAFEATKSVVLEITGLELVSLPFQLSLAQAINARLFQARDGLVVRQQNVVKFVLIHDQVAGIFPDHRLLRLCVTSVLSPPSCEELVSSLHRRLSDPPKGELAWKAATVFIEVRRVSKGFRIPPTVRDFIEWVEFVQRSNTTEALLAYDWTQDPITKLPSWELLFHDPRDIKRIFES